MHILIAGAGIGGLALAQRLLRAGSTVTVLERDPAMAARPQGYRININADGGSALRECLPDSRYDLFRATSSRPDGGRIVTYDHRFTELAAHTGPTHPYTAVNRLTLRQILLTGLNPRFAAEVTGFTADRHGVRAHLADGADVTGDVLIAADGTGSLLRPALIGDPGFIEAGVRCVWGRTPLAAIPCEARDPAWANRVSTFVGPDGHVLVTGAWVPRVPPAHAAAHLTPQPPYVMWALMTTAPLPGTPDGLHAYARAAVDGWDPRLRTLVGRGGGCFAVPIRAARPVPPWPPGRITLLGDAVHTMTPAGGTGANTALRDAALLGGLLAEAGADPVPAIAAYEHEMRDYGFAAVARSLEYGRDLARPIPAMAEEAGS